MPLIYLKRKTDKVSNCFVCLKQTTTVLRNDQDWFYVCESHLKDLGFCKPYQFDDGTTADTVNSTATPATTANTAINTTADTPKVSKESTEFILHSSFQQMRESLKKPRPKPKEIQFPEIPKSKLL